MRSASSATSHYYQPAMGHPPRRRTAASSPCTSTPSSTPSGPTARAENSSLTDGAPEEIPFAENVAVPTDHNSTLEPSRPDDPKPAQERTQSQERTQADERWRYEALARDALSRDESLRLLALTQAFCDLYFRLSSDGTILDYNAPHSADLYSDPEQFLGRKMQEVLPSAPAQVFEAAFEQLRAHRAATTIEYSLPMAEGLRYYEARLVPLPENQIAVVARDVSFHKKTEAVLRQTESQFRGIFENAVEGIFQTTPDGRYLSANPALAALYGYESPAELIGGITDIQHQLYVDPGRRKEFARLMKKHGKVSRFESPIRRCDGSVIWISENARAIRDEAGVLLGYEGTVEDITERVQADIQRRKAEDALRASETKLREVVEHSSNLFYSHTPDGVLTYLSPQTRTFFDCEPSEALVSWTEFCTDHPINAVGLEVCRRAIETGDPQPPYELELKGRRDRVIWVEVNEAPVVKTLPNGARKTVAVVGALVDVTRRKAVEAQLKHQAFHDALTGLPNRALFIDRLEHALARTQRRRRSTRRPGEEEAGPALLFLDLDRFKVVNDSLGHDSGDRLLVEVARRLQSCLRPDDTAARLGGDEFTILIEDTSNAADVVAVAERIAEQLQHPFNLGGHNVFITTSVGIVFSRAPDDTAESLLRDADVAMYRAKAKGRAAYEVFDPAMNARALERLHLESDLRQAIEKGEFELHYQPKYQLASKRLVAFEALVRWQHPTRGLVPPNDFIPLAEETGLILPIGHWVLRQACTQAQCWREKYATAEDECELEMSVNLSARQLHQPDLVSQVASILGETGLPPHFLKLEITESVVMDDAEHTIRTLRALSDLGVKLAIDDFGTGYSSLSYLRRFPINCLKVDRMFVQNLGDNCEDTEIVRAVVSLAKTLGLEVVAEGVETETQLLQLRELGCDRGQGYYFAPALPVAQAGDLLK